MSGLHSDSHAISGSAATQDFHTINPAAFQQPPPPPPPPPPAQETLRQLQARGSEGSPQPKAVEDWPAAGGGQAGSLDYSSSEDCSKEKLDERMSLNSCSDSGFRTPLCRICFQGPEQGELLSPCRCSGSVRCSHEPCLIKWISERGAWSCELCYYKYHVISISTKNPLQWQSISLTVIEKVQIAAAVLGSLFLVASISWLVWSSLSPHARWQRQDLLFQICYAMYGFMDVVCIVLIVHEGPSVFRIFHRWQAVNQRWKVLNYDKARDLEEQQKPGSTPRGHPSLTEADPRIRLPSGGQLGTERPSPSTSSLLAAVAAAEAAATSSPRVAAAAAGHGTARRHEDEEDSGTSPTTMTTTSESEPSNNTGNSLSPVTEQNRSYRWTYSLLHLLGHRRPFMEQQNPEEQGLGPAPAPAPASASAPAPPRPRDSHRELVMRVTTV
ncbi:E3 ubiquitin-protein ligase MARCHF4-like [Centroberyx affinis]|uniref:E3 ubiquitin-protein ligase MARCHF4-like n=1 Tax=Centroberyx affinis TaxID=166261 RepID=UPI003A5BE40F